MLYAQAEALHAHGLRAEACALSAQLAEYLLANPPSFRTQSAPSASGVQQQANKALAPATVASPTPSSAHAPHSSPSTSTSTATGSQLQASNSNSNSNPNPNSTHSSVVRSNSNSMSVQQQHDLTHFSSNVLNKLAFLCSVLNEFSSGVATSDSPLTRNLNATDLINLQFRLALYVCTTSLSHSPRWHSQLC